MEAGAHDWVLPVMSAHVQAARNVSLHGKGEGGQQQGQQESVGTLLLISRRSCLRQVQHGFSRGWGRVCGDGGGDGMGWGPEAQRARTHTYTNENEKMDFETRAGAS